MGVIAKATRFLGRICGGGAAQARWGKRATEALERELKELRERDANSQYVTDFYMGRTLVWRREAYRLAAKTGEPLEVDAGIPHDSLMAEAKAALAAGSDSPRDEETTNV